MPGVGVLIRHLRLSEKIIQGERMRASSVLLGRRTPVSLCHERQVNV